MAYLCGNRYQAELLPPSIEEYVSKDDPVRVYEAFVEAIELSGLGIEAEPVRAGSPEYNPKVMIKLLVYGYSYGIRSSRKLERACYHNISFIWLMEGLKPDYRTVARFRREHKELLKGVFKQCAKLCVEFDLIEGNTLFVDGSKIRGNASINNTWTKERCKKSLENIDKRIDEILDECDAIDEKEEGAPSLVKLAEELSDKESLKEKIQTAMQKLDEEGKKTINSTDPDCVNFKGRQGTHAGYNAQIVVDEKHGLILHSDVVNENNDLNQFANQVEQANENLKEPCSNACADAGYANTEELKKVNDKNIKVIVPTQKQASGNEPDQFDKEYFRYDSKEDCYFCPEGKRLKYSHFSAKKGHKLYRMANKNNCISCKNYGTCTDSKRGRAIIRLVSEDTKIKIEQQYKSEAGQSIYKLRKQKVELPFGHIKRNLGVGSFLVRGLPGVKSEMSVISTCFNIVRMITIFGVAGLLEKLLMRA